jgi:hypothetical protein
MELNNYELQSLKDIEIWENAKHEGFHKKILDVASESVDYLIKKLGPERFRRFEEAIESTIKRLVFTSKYTVDPQELIKRAHNHDIMIKDLSDLKRCDLEKLDKCNRKNINFHEKAAAIQGAVLGLGGAVVAVADLTTILIQDFHMIQEIAYCYSYDPNDVIEKEIILMIIEAAIGGSKLKFESLKEIERLKKLKRKRLSKKTQPKGTSMLGAKVLEGYIEDLTVALLIRLIPRSLPVISMAVSAHSNHEIMENSGNTAFMVYRKRFIERKKTLS